MTKQPTNGYLARPVLIPEIVVSGADEAEALERVRAAIAQFNEHSRIVRVDVPAVAESNKLISSGLPSDSAKLQLMEQAATDPLFLADLIEVTTR